MPSREVLFQSEHHPLVAERFETLEQYCLFLIHKKAYEAAAKLAEGKVVLDLGCNNGYGSAVLARSAKRLVGADVSARSVDAARSRHPALEFVLVDGVNLPFGDASFELVTSFQVIEHVDNVSPFLAEIRRVLAPGGHAVFTTPNREIRLMPGMKPWNEFHVREYSALGLRDELSRTFRVVQLLGLTATAELARIELRRVERLCMNASTVQGAARSAVLTRLRHPAVLTKLRQALRGMLVRLPAARNRRERYFQRFSTRDLQYVPDPAADALDLMAVCDA